MAAQSAAGAAQAPGGLRSGGQGETERGGQNEERKKVDVLRGIPLLPHHNHDDR